MHDRFAPSPCPLGDLFRRAERIARLPGTVDLLRFIPVTTSAPLRLAREEGLSAGGDAPCLFETSDRGEEKQGAEKGSSPRTRARDNQRRTSSSVG